MGLCIPHIAKSQGETRLSADIPAGYHKIVLFIQ